MTSTKFIPGYYAPGSRVNPDAPGNYQIDPNGPLNEARPNGITWNPGAAQVFASRNSIDPTTGRMIGPDSLVPANQALQWQAEHNRRVWDYRQNLMKDAQSYGMGALGLMQSFRPGGGATIEAGQYNTLAQIQLNRAQLTEPMDLLADYRRHESATARSKANRMAERQMAVQIGVALAGAAATIATAGAAAPAAAAAISAVGNVASAGVAASAARSGGGGYGGAMANLSTRAMMQYNLQGMERQRMGLPPIQGPQPGGGGGGAPQQPGGVQPGLPATQPGSQPRAPGGGAEAGAPQAMQSQLAPEGAAGPQAGGGQPEQRAGGAAPGAIGGMGRPPVGADGMFLPQNYAASGAVAQDPFQSAILSKQAADQIDDDPFYSAYSYAVNLRFAQRMRAA